MGRKYEKNKNPINDLFLDLLFNNFDFKKKEAASELYGLMVYAIEDSLFDPDDIQYLDFLVGVEEGNYITVVANNIITALWFCGIIPMNSDEVMQNNSFTFSGYKYTFNKKQKKLKIKKI